MTPVSHESEPSMPQLGDAPCITQDDITRVTELEKFLGQLKAKMIVSKINHVIWSQCNGLFLVSINIFQVSKE